MRKDGLCIEEKVKKLLYQEHIDNGKNSKHEKKFLS